MEMRSTSDRSKFRLRQLSSGFTLIELLIVIAIIGTLAGMIVAGISRVKGQTKKAQASHDISTIFASGVKSFQFDMGFYPAYDKACDDDDLEEFNAFPVLYVAICDDPPSKGGKGGKNAPYAELKIEGVVVVDEDVQSGYRTADRDEVSDSEVEKFYLDPWGSPYLYRENDSKKKRKDWMINPRGFDFWSRGPDGKNEACYGRDEVGDDIGNW